MHSRHSSNSLLRRRAGHTDLSITIKSDPIIAIWDFGQCCRIAYAYDILMMQSTLNWLENWPLVLFALTKPKVVTIVVKASAWETCEMYTKEDPNVGQSGSTMLCVVSVPGAKLIHRGIYFIGIHKYAHNPAQSIDASMGTKKARENRKRMNGHDIARVKENTQFVSITYFPTQKHTKHKRTTNFS